MTLTLLAGAAMALTSFQDSTSRADCPPSQTVSYMEFPRAGDHQKAGRKIPGHGGRIFAVDVDSRIEIQFDTLCLRGYLAAQPDTDAPTQLLSERLGSLGSAVKADSQAMFALAETFGSYDAAERDSAKLAVFFAKLRQSSRLLLAVIRPLRLAIMARFEGSGMDIEAARRATENRMLPAFQGPQGFNWSNLGQLLNDEIRFAEETLEARRRTSVYSLELRAHLLTGTGGRVPLALPGHNAETPGAPRPFQRFEFAISAEQQALFDRAESLASTIQATRNLAEGIKQQLTHDLEGTREQIEDLARRAKEAAKPVLDQVLILRRWSDTAVAAAWVRSTSQSLAQDPAGTTVLTAWADLRTAIAESRADLQALVELAGLEGELKGAGADEALAALLRRFEAIRQIIEPGDVLAGDGIALRALNVGSWRERAKRLQAFIDAVQALKAPLRKQVLEDPKSPVADMLRLIAALEAAAGALQGLATEAIGILARALGLPPVLVATNLPEPKGQLRLVLGKHLDTSIDLETIAAERHENDGVLVEYRFFAGDRPLTGGWSDQFVLRVFGWRSQVAAGLAFALREHQESWRPGAAVSWVFTHRGWPGADNPGTGDRLGLGQIGIGLTAINLHFDNSEVIELGVGPSLSFLAQRILVGGGWNLQVEKDHLYGFLSLRLINVGQVTPN